MSEPREREEAAGNPADAEPSTASPSAEPTPEVEARAVAPGDPHDHEEEDEDEDELDEEEEDEGVDDDVPPSRADAKPRPSWSELAKTAANAQADWGPIARCLALGGLLGFTSAGWVQLGLSGRVASELLANIARRNDQYFGRNAERFRGRLLSAQLYKP